MISRAPGDACSMAGIAPRDVVLVGAFPAAWIAVRGPQEHQHFLPLADNFITNFHSTRGGAEEGLHRAFQPHRLLERCARQGRIGPQLREGCREARQTVDCGTDAVHCRVHTRGQQ